jgi:hypothetical protein
MQCICLFVPSSLPLQRIPVPASVQGDVQAYTADFVLLQHQLRQDSSSALSRLDLDLWRRCIDGRYCRL